MRGGVSAFPCPCQPCSGYLPHMRGGVSIPCRQGAAPPSSSPHAWGCFLPSGAYLDTDFIFPTCVGVFPSQKAPLFRYVDLPHMRGGVSSFSWAHGYNNPSSPHAWGCFQNSHHVNGWKCIFPTCVGVFLHIIESTGGDLNLPHMRGGVSTHNKIPGRAFESSPHAWGCFSASSSF